MIKDGVEPLCFLQGDVTFLTYNPPVRHRDHLCTVRVQPPLQLDSECAPWSRFVSLPLEAATTNGAVHPRKAGHRCK